MLVVLCPVVGTMCQQPMSGSACGELGFGSLVQVSHQAGMAYLLPKALLETMQSCSHLISMALHEMPLMELVHHRCQGMDIWDEIKSPTFIFSGAGFS